MGSKLKTWTRIEDLERMDGFRAWTSKEKADTLNQFTDFGLHSKSKGITSVDIQEDEIRKRLENLDINTSPGPYELYPRILKELAKAQNSQ